MATLIFDSSLKSAFDSAMGNTNAENILAEGDKTSSKGVDGVKSIKSLLTESVNFLTGLSGSTNPVIQSYSDVDMGSFGAQRFGQIVNCVTPGSTSTMTPSVLMWSAIDVERALVTHFLNISQDKDNVPAKIREKAKELAADMEMRVAVDYRNLCIILNDPASPVLDEKPAGVDIMKSLPTGKNLYKVYNYVNTEFDTLTPVVCSAPILSQADIDAKAVSKRSLKRGVIVKAEDLKERWFTSKNLGKEYADSFGGLNRKDKRVLKGSLVAAALIALGIAIAAVGKSCEAHNQSEDTTTTQGTMAPEDTEINNPADSSQDSDKGPETDTEGEIITETDTTDYSKPVTDRNNDKGASDDFQSPIETGGVVSSPADSETEETPTVEEVTSEPETYNDNLFDNPAAGNEEPDYEGAGPNRGSSSDEDEDEGPLAGRF